MFARSNKFFLKLTTVLFIGFYSSTIFAGDKEKILNAAIEGIKLGMKFKVVKNLIEKDNRFENIYINSRKIHFRLNEDNGNSCSTTYFFQNHKESKNNLTVTDIKKTCSYKKRENKLSLPNYFSEISKKHGTPDYVGTSHRGMINNYIFIASNELSPYKNRDDFVKKCAIEIRKSGKAGTNSKALAIARKLLPSGFKYKDIANIEKNKKHSILENCPDISDDYLKFLKERYSTILSYEIWIRKKEIARTVMVLSKGDDDYPFLTNNRFFKKELLENYNEIKNHPKKANQPLKNSNNISQNAMKEKIKYLEKKLEACRKI